MGLASLLENKLYIAADISFIQDLLLDLVQHRLADQRAFRMLPNDDPLRIFGDSLIFLLFMLTYVLDCSNDSSMSIYLDLTEIRHIQSQDLRGR